MSIAPLFMRSGLVNKVIDSMAAGVPSSGTNVFNGLPGFVNGRHGFNVFDAQQWQELLVEKLTDPQALHQVSVAGRELVQQQMRWPKTVERLHQKLIQIVDKTATENGAQTEESLVA